MKKIPKPDNNGTPQSGRRRFFTTFLGLAGGAAALLLPQRKGRELPLSEAKFYKKHDLAG